MTIDPIPDVLNEYEDFFGNKVTYFAIQQEHRSLTVTVSSEITRTRPAAPQIDLFGHQPWEEVKRELTASRQEYADVLQYIPETPLTTADQEIRDFALQSFTPGRSLFAAAKDMMERIYIGFQFQPGFTTLSTPLSEVMKERKGVCQDFAHLAIACLRSMGLPARYISGYIETIPRKGRRNWWGPMRRMPGSPFSYPEPDGRLRPYQQPAVIRSAPDHRLGEGLCGYNSPEGVIVSSGPHQLSVSVDVRRMG